MQPKFNQNLNVVVHCDFRTWIQSLISTGMIDSVCGSFRLPGDTDTWTTVNGIFMTTNVGVGPGNIKLGGFDPLLPPQYKIEIGGLNPYVPISISSPVSCDINAITGNSPDTNPIWNEIFSGYSDMTEFVQDLVATGPKTAFLTDTINSKESVAIFAPHQVQYVGSVLDYINLDKDITNAAGGITLSPSTLDWVVTCISGVTFSCDCSNGQYIKTSYPIACPNNVQHC